MRKIFESHRQEKVGHYQSILESSGICTLIKNDCQAAAEGNFGPADPILPELWVIDDGDYDRAIEILTPLYENSTY